MSIFSKLHYISRLSAAVFLMLSFLCACSHDNTDLSVFPDFTAEKYINLNIVVSAGSEGGTRAMTRGDGEDSGSTAASSIEDGDGRELGSVRESTVKGITLMLYHDEAGINTQDDETKIDFVKYYPVELTDETASDCPYPNNIEAVYTTGEQLLGADFDLTKEYHAIVVANLDLTGTVAVGSSLKTIVENIKPGVRDRVIDKIYTGGGIGVDATDFVMSLEDSNNEIINFANVTPERNGNKLVYNFDNIRIERLAARVDFWMKNATYNDDCEGYEYKVWRASDTNTPTSSDRFVLTAVTPFNLYNGDEYLFKRINDGGAIKYLGDENTGSYVIDPKTKDKTLVQTSPLYYDNTLASLINEDNQNHTLVGKADFCQLTKKLHSDMEKYKEDPTYKTQWVSFQDDGGYDNFILCYPKENTLKDDSPLYYYATGVAIEGDYYKDGVEEPEHRIYYGYLRHQREPLENGASTYSIKMAKDLEVAKEQEKAGAEGVAMNFGVVRNNIYRISIDKITEQGELRIEVKKWDPFTHSTIYM